MRRSGDKVGWREKFKKNFFKLFIFVWRITGLQYCTGFILKIYWSIVDYSVALVRHTEK